MDLLQKGHCLRFRDRHREKSSGLAHKLKGVPMEFADGLGVRVRKKTIVKGDCKDRLSNWPNGAAIR